MRLICCFAVLASMGIAQEAESGFDLRGIASVAAMQSPALSTDSGNAGSFAVGFQSILYPTWKINSHWSILGAVQVRSSPYFREEFGLPPRNRVKADILQANVSYVRQWSKAFLNVRAGQMTSAFGSFLLRYDPAVNPLVDLPAAYGYYYKPVSNLGLLGAQVDATVGRADFRGQFTNSSPANARSPFDHDQYGSWTAGGGFTIQQGFRIGGSVYRGPYLDRDYPYFFPGEANPRGLPATGTGIDVQWGHGPWNLNGEWQHFKMDYKLIPTFTEHTGYSEIRRTLTPRWYAAARISYVRASAFPSYEIYEIAAGYRPNRFQLIKAGYELQAGPAIRGTLQNSAVVQFITTFHAL